MPGFDWLLRDDEEAPEEPSFGWLTDEQRIPTPPPGALPTPSRSSGITDEEVASERGFMDWLSQASDRVQDLGSSFLPRWHGRLLKRGHAFGLSTPESVAEAGIQKVKNVAAKGLGGHRVAQPTREALEAEVPDVRGSRGTEPTVRELYESADRDLERREQAKARFVEQAVNPADKLARQAYVGMQELAGAGSQEIYAAPLDIVAGAAAPRALGRVGSAVAGALTNAAQNVLLEGIDRGQIGVPAVTGAAFGGVFGWLGGNIRRAAAAGLDPDTLLDGATMDDAVVAAGKLARESLERRFNEPVESAVRLAQEPRVDRAPAVLESVETTQEILDPSAVIAARQRKLGAPKETHGLTVRMGEEGNAKVYGVMDEADPEVELARALVEVKGDRAHIDMVSPAGVGGIGAGRGRKLYGLIAEEHPEVKWIGSEERIGGARGSEAKAKWLPAERFRAATPDEAADDGFSELSRTVSAAAGRDPLADPDSFDNFDAIMDGYEHGEYVKEAISKGARTPEEIESYFNDRLEAEWMFDAGEEGGSSIGGYYRTLKSGEKKYYKKTGMYRPPWQNNNLERPAPFDVETADERWLTAAQRRARKAAPTNAVDEATSSEPPLSLVGPHLDSLPGAQTLSKAGRALRRLLTTTGAAGTLDPKRTYGQAVKDFLTRTETVGGRIAEEQRLVVQRIAARTTAAEFIVHDFDAALDNYMADLAAQGVERDRASVLEYVLDGLEDKNDLSKVSEDLAGATERMRVMVDDLSGELAGNEAIPLSESMRELIRENEGSYLNRSFAFYGKPEEWRRIVLEEEPWRFEGMKRVMRQLYPKMSEDKIEARLLTKLHEDPSVFFAGPSRVAKHDVFKPRKHAYWVRHEDGRERLFLSETRAKKYLQANENRGARAADAAARADAGEILTPQEKAAITRGKAYSPAEISKEPLPQEIDDFLGLSRDPRARTLRTVAHVATEIEVANYLDDVRATGLAEGFLSETPNSEAGFLYEIQGSPLNPLRGLYAKSAEQADVIHHLAEYEERSLLPPWMRFWVAANSGVRFGKTGLSSQTHVRNTRSWDEMIRFQGKYLYALRVPRALSIVAEGAGRPKTAVGRAFKQKTADGARMVADRVESVGGRLLRNTFKMDQEQTRLFWTEGVKLGVFGEGARSGEARYDIAQISQLTSQSSKEKLARFLQPWKTFYVAEDDLGKGVAWMAEMSDYAHALDLDLTTKEGLREAMEVTAPIVRDLYPTYSKAPLAVRYVRDFPIMADFPTFTSEMVRTTKNTLLHAVAEMRSDNLRIRKIGAKRMAGAIATTFATPQVTRAAYRSVNGGADETKEELSRRLGPHYNRRADYLILETTETGVRAIDLSYSNPHAFLREAWISLTDPSATVDEKLVNSIMVPMEAMWGEAILMSSAIDFLRGQTKGGRPVDVPNDTLLNRAMDRASLYDRLLPGEITGLRRLFHAATIGEDPDSGRKLHLSDELLARGIPTSPETIIHPGARITDIDFSQGFRRELHAYNANVLAARNRWESFDKKAWMPADERLEKKEEMVAAARRSWEYTRSTVELLRKDGYSYGTLSGWRKGVMSKKNFERMWLGREPDFETIWSRR